MTYPCLSVLFLCCLMACSQKWQHTDVDLQGKTFHNGTVFISTSMYDPTTAYTFDADTYVIHVTTNDSSQFRKYAIEYGTYDVNNDMLRLRPVSKWICDLGADIRFPCRKGGSYDDGYLVSRDTLVQNERHLLEFAPRQYLLTHTADDIRFQAEGLTILRAANKGVPAPSDDR